MSPDLAFEERELSELYERTLNEMRYACRRTYLMVREDGESYKGAASRLGVSRSTVCARIVEAQGRLRRELAEQGSLERQSFTK
jgi:DNA-directed RNA polymerase specialized sigma24 family protein